MDSNLPLVQYLLGLRVRTWFWVDLAGAALSAFLLGLMLPVVREHLGLPLWVLYGLAVVPVGFGLYDLACLLFVRRNLYRYLRVTAMLNVLYCGLSLLTIVLHYGVMQPLAWIYFSGEILLVFGMAWLEWEVARRPHPNT